jgi:ketosteroid isomerase-like protein
MEPVQVVLGVWARIAARDWTGLAMLLAPDVRLYWPATGEVFVGRENFVSVQAEYPEGWTITVLTTVAQDEAVVSEVEVPHQQFGLFRAASFWTVRSGVVVAATEYWVTVGGEQPPGWRAAYAQGT